MLTSQTPRSGGSSQQHRLLLRLILSHTATKKAQQHQALLLQLVLSHSF